MIDNTCFPAPPLATTQKRYKKPPKILFIGEAVSLAHVGRPAMLANWAKDAGYDVHFACGATFSKIVKSEGLNPIDLNTIPCERFYTRLNKGHFFYTPEELDQYVLAERTLLRKLKPDLVVGDFRLTLHVSAALEGVPMLALNNAQWSPTYATPMPPPRAGVFKYVPSALRSALFRPIRPLALRLFAKPIDDLRQKHGLPRLNDFRKCYTAGDACAYLDHPDLMSLEQIPDGHFFMGPIAWKPNGNKNLSETKCPSDGPLAYVSMGSTGDQNLIPRILKALDETGYSVALSGVDPKQVESWLEKRPSLRGRIRAERLMDPHEILKRASITICHGGSGTVYQSLSRGVPLLCLPDNPDQMLISQAVAVKGVGCHLDVEGVSVECLKSMITSEFIENNSYQSSAIQLSKKLSAWNTREQWQHWLEGRFTFNWKASDRLASVLLPG